MSPIIDHGQDTENLQHIVSKDIKELNFKEMKRRRKIYNWALVYIYIFIPIVSS